MGLELVLVNVQVEQYPSAKVRVYISDSHSWLQRMLRKGLNVVLHAIFGVRNRKGHTLLAVFRRPNSH